MTPLDEAGQPFPATSSGEAAPAVPGRRRNLTTARLADLAEINPRVPSTLAADEEVAFVPMAALSAASASVVRSETRRFADVAKGYTTFRNGDLLVAKITPCFENSKIGQANLHHPWGFGSTEFHVVRPRPDKAAARYLLHFLRQDYVRAAGERRMTGSAGQRRVPEQFLAGLQVPSAPLSEQTRIASILDQADALRTKRRAALAQLDELVGATFAELFGDPTLNPMGWPRLPLGDLISDGPQNGLYKPASAYGSGTPILRIDSFYDGVVGNLAHLKRVRLSDAERNLYRLASGDIVVNRVNSMEYLGKSAIIPPLAEPTVFESNMMRFGLDCSRADPRYVVRFLQTGFVKAQIWSAAKHAINQSSINQKDVAAFRINLPPLTLQQAFANRLEAVARLRATHEAARTATETLFASLQHRAFRGEL